ncbi:hypothetical protein IFR04_016116 [Cadophora malorum]|uniref:Uncharacterized protein n=1 Tax=Cadophora malorum TaxID=108018 RepID=A0A8H7T1I8_9HELO|nr:hypothetical protein IFR04_016116 [Cadophora malorum]
MPHSTTHDPITQPRSPPEPARPSNYFDRPGPSETTSDVSSDGPHEVRPHGRFQDTSNGSLTSSNLNTRSSGPNQLECWTNLPERHEWIAYRMQG